MCLDILLAFGAGVAVLGVFAVAVLTASGILRGALSCSDQGLECQEHETPNHTAVS